MRKNLFTFLSLLLVLSLLAACGSGAAASVQESADASAVESVEEPAEAPAPEPEPEPEPEAISAAEPDSAVEAEAPEEPEELPELELPLTTNGESFKMMLNFPGFLSNFLSSYSEQSCFLKAMEDTGVHIDFQEFSMENMSTQMSLIAASGDYPDYIFDVNMYYAGGSVKALSDEFIMDIADLAEEYAPHYMAVVNSDQAHRNAAYDDEGHMAGFQGYNNIVFSRNGPIIRQDWLDDLNLETPVTVSDWHEVLTAFKDAYGLQDALFMGSTGQDEYHICGAFGSAGIMGMYHKDGVVYSGYNDEGFHEYLKTMAQWYSEGIIGSDFLSRSSNLMDSGVEQAAISGLTGIFFSPANTIEEYTASARSAGDANCQFAALASPTSDDGETDHFGPYQSYTGDHCVSISTTCENPELAVQFLNYFFTPQGQMLVSYGIEGEAYELDADGNPQYTDLILNNQEGIPMLQFCLVKYTLTDMPSVIAADRSWFTYTQDQIDAQLDVWLNSEDGTWTIPPVTLTTEESEAYYGVESDIQTYVEECTVKFIIGDMDINTQWEEYTAQLDTMGIEDGIEIYQAALDRYMAR